MLLTSKEQAEIRESIVGGNAVIYWGDETGISNCENCERGFSPKGHPPALPVETKKERLNIIELNSFTGAEAGTIPDSKSVPR